MLSTLPAPSAFGLAHSQRLTEHIVQEIEHAGDWISFARYMQLALYAPGLGYYMAGQQRFGARGDFVTAPELSPLFARTLARQLAQLFEARACPPRVLELGAGSGAMAADLLRELDLLGTPIERYAILELSGALRTAQRERIESSDVDASRVSWLDTLPETFSGMVLGNELLDAVPCELVAWRADGIFQRGIAWREGGFAWSERRASGELLARAQHLQREHAIAPPYVSEINLQAEALVSTLARTLEQGVMLLFDYGFEADTYYHPQRSQGTLMCHYRQHAHDDVFLWPGLQDITAHVDFSAIGAAGRRAGLQLLGYSNQTRFLLNCGITDVLAQSNASDVSRYAPLAAQAQRLLQPSEMGELFKVLALGRGLDLPLLGFAARAELL